MGSAVEIEDDAYFELRFSPNVTLVPTVRRFVTEFYAQVFKDDDGTSRIAVATHELLENAVKYSVDHSTRIRIGVRRTGDGRFVVTIETSNRAKPADIETVRGSVAEIETAPDSLAHYQTVMRRNATLTEGSGLGLARVSAETDMSLHCYVDGDTLFLTARGELAGGAR
jgi:anti-sigma regulatory factor (Ser/Thr protein kinase)